jgi:hypothetical protein
MTDVNGICEEYDNDKEGEEYESSPSSTHLNVLHSTDVKPDFCSYSSLQTMLYTNFDDEDLKEAKLNNTIKKLLDIIRNPLNEEDIGYICYLFNKFMTYNGFNAFVSLYNELILKFKNN